MKTTAHITVAERIGRGLGHAWLAIRRQEARVVQHLMHQGLSRGVATLILWTVTLLVLGVLLYVAFWLALLLILLATAGTAVSHIDEGASEEHLFSDEPDHKNKLFYDPINYSDDPDPRFDDK